VSLQLTGGPVTWTSEYLAQALVPSLVGAKGFLGGPKKGDTPLYSAWRVCRVALVHILTE